MQLKEKIDKVQLKPSKNGDQRERMVESKEHSICVSFNMMFYLILLYILALYQLKHFETTRKFSLIESIYEYFDLLSKSDLSMQKTSLTVLQQCRKNYRSMFM